MSPSAIAWIGSLQAFFVFAGGLVGGPLFDRYGAKVCVTTLKPLKRPTYLIHSFLGHSARSISLHRQHHDDKPLHKILPVHACTRRPRRYR